jgi:hypothetical protein
VKTKVNEGGLKGLTKLLRPGLYLGIFSLIQPLVALLGQAAAGAGALVSAISPAVGHPRCPAGGDRHPGDRPRHREDRVRWVHEGHPVVRAGAGNLKKTSPGGRRLPGVDRQGPREAVPAEQQAVKNYKSLQTAQAGYRAGLAKLSPQEAAAVRSVQSSTAPTHDREGSTRTCAAAGKPCPRSSARPSTRRCASRPPGSPRPRACGACPRRRSSSSRTCGRSRRRTRRSRAAQKAVDAALKDLSPSAKTAALAIYGLQGAWKKTKKSVQESIFSGFAKDIEPAAKTLLPLLSRRAVWGRHPARQGRPPGDPVHADAPVPGPVPAAGRPGRERRRQPRPVRARPRDAFGNIAVASIPLQNRMLGVIGRFSATGRRPPPPAPRPGRRCGRSSRTPGTPPGSSAASSGTSARPSSGCSRPGGAPGTPSWTGSRSRRTGSSTTSTPQGLRVDQVVLR